MEFLNDILPSVNKCGSKFITRLYTKDKYGLTYTYLFPKRLFKTST